MFRASTMFTKEEIVVDGLTHSELQATKEFLEELGHRQKECNNDPVGWPTAVKFLMARKFDVQRAVDLYMSHEAVRKKEGILLVDPREDVIRKELLTEKFTVLPGRDSNGAAIALFTVKLHSAAVTSHQAVLKSLIFQLDAALSSQDTQRNGLVFIYDMTQSKYSNFDYDLSIKILSMLKGSYPARLKKVLIVTAPLWFKAPFKFLRLFVREKLRDRVHTVNISQLVLHIPHNSLPKRFGGKMDVCHKDWIRKCLQVAWGKTSDTDNEIVAYIESCENHICPDLSVSSLASSSGGGATTPTGDDSSVFSSDIEIESESSRGTVQEKHNNEYKEKEINLEMDMSDDAVMTSPPTSPNSVSTSSSPPLAIVGHNVSVKRSPESSPTDTHPGDANLPPLPRKKRPNATPSPTPPVEDSLHVPEPGGYTVKELLEYCKIKQRKGLYKEYAMIRAEPPSGTFDIAKAKANTPKNRYTDVLCMDDTRVKLSMVDGIADSDYINANFVDGYRHKRAYISTQGPLPRTFGDFWRMVWEHMVLLVVMTTRTVERGRLKCGQYWPAEEKGLEEYGDFTVVNSGSENYANYILSSLILQNNKTGESREITHLQFTSWPDYGVPHSAEAFLMFMLHVRRAQAERVKALGSRWSGHEDGPPIVIHCSAGIGRTGTFITMDICTRRIADINTVNIQKTVRRIRSQRAFSIQMPDQYVFCHLALLEHAQRERLISEISLDNFEDSSSDSE